MNWSRTISYDDLGPGAVAPGYEPTSWGLPVEFFRALTRDDPSAHHYLLLRFILANVLGMNSRFKPAAQLVGRSRQAARDVA